MNKPNFVSPPSTFFRRQRGLPKDCLSNKSKIGRAKLDVTAQANGPSISRRSLLRAASICAVASFGGVAQASTSQQRPISSLLAQTVAASALRRSVLFELASGSLLPVTALPHILNKSPRCVLVGEIHDEIETHAAQLATIQHLYENGDRQPVVVAFEQFYRTDNSVLDQYISRSISLDSMLRKTQWKRNWGFDPALYIPIFRFCRLNRIKMIGMNIPSQVISLISQVGLDGIPYALREQLPTDIDIYNKVHKEHFLNAMGYSEPSNAVSAHWSMSGKLDKWYQSQCTWDEVMSEAIANELSQNPSARVVALAGTGHIDTRTAIPDRVQKRTGERPFSIVTKPVGWNFVAGISLPDIERPDPCADVVWYTPRKLDLA